MEEEGTGGDGQALDALRAREAAQGLKGDTIQGDGPAKPGHAPVIDSITKKGTIIYRAGSSAVSSQADRAGVVAWWWRCAWRWNAMASALPVSGSVESKAAAIRAAVDVQ